MAIAVDTTASGIASATSVTFSHTCTGSDLVLVVNVYVKADNISTVTYNSVAMTQVAAETSGNPRVYTYVLVGPATGAHNVVATGGASTTVIGASSVSFTGATGSSAANTATANSASAALTITTNKQSGFVVVGYGCANATVPTYTGGGTEYGAQTSGNDRIRSAYEAFSGGADKTETWSLDGGGGIWHMSGVEIYETLPSGGFFMFM
jgi:hypothetical protein